MLIKVCGRFEFMLYITTIVRNVQKLDDHKQFWFPNILLTAVYRY